MAGIIDSAYQNALNWAYKTSNSFSVIEKLEIEGKGQSISDS